MIKKTKCKAGTGLILILILNLAVYLILSADQEPRIKMKVVQLDEGYGYEILIEGRVVIHQEYMPGAAGLRPFASEKEALTVAGLVVAKLRKREAPALVRRDWIEAGLQLE